MPDPESPVNDDWKCRGYAPLPAVIQHQHAHLADEVARLTAENKRLQAHLEMFNRGQGFTLSKLCEALGWQGGTIHQVLAEVRRLIEENRQLRARLPVVQRVPDESREI